MGLSFWDYYTFVPTKVYSRLIDIVFKPYTTNAAFPDLWWLFTPPTSAFKTNIICAYICEISNKSIT